jgi:hypothetical protein
MAGLFGGGMDESKQQRLLLLSAALTAPGTLADKFQLMALSQGAYTELQNAQGRETGQKDAEAERLRLESESRIGLQGAQTDESRQRASESAAKTPLELRNLTRTGEKLDLELKHAQEDYDAIAAIDPKGAKRAKAKLDEAQAKVAEHRARANQANAAAGESSARATGVGQVNDARKILADPNSTPAQRSQAQVVVSGGKDPTTAKKDHLDMVSKYYKQANPTATDQEAAQFALDNETGAKGDLIKAAIALTESTNKLDQEEGLTILRQVAKKRAGGASTGTGTKEATQADWDKARNSVKKGQTYTGPDGQTYTRKE